MRPRLVSLFVGALLATACGDATDPAAPTADTSPETAVSTTVPAPPAGEPTATASVSPWPAALGGEHQRWTVRVLARVPHDDAAFTQGLEQLGDALLESTGRRGSSSLRVLDPATGATRQSVDLDAELFGEGLTVVDDEIVQLTLDAGVAVRYDATTLEAIGRHTYEGEGWGLCFGDAGLWMSDGTSQLTRRDPDDLEALATRSVQRDGAAIAEINELECIGDHVVANVWKRNEILVIDTASGTVDATIDATALAAEINATDSEAVLNGIADLGDGTLLLGGKLWPTFFVVELVTA